jgi:hypothetical protein
MVRFYVNNEKDAKRCRQAMEAKFPVSIPGLTLDGDPKIFTGLILSVEEVSSNPKMRWRVIMRS